MIIFFSATLVVCCMYRYAHICTQIYMYMYVYLLGLSQIEYCKTICHGKFLRFLMDCRYVLPRGLTDLDLWGYPRAEITIADFIISICSHFEI